MALQIKQLLKERGLTAVQLADKMGITQGALSLAINGNPTLSTLEKIAEALGVSVPELFQQDEIHITCPKCGAQIKIKAE